MDDKAHRVQAERPGRLGVEAQLVLVLRARRAVLGSLDIYYFGGISRRRSTRGPESGRLGTMGFATRGSMVAAKAADTLTMDGALLWFSERAAGAAQHVEKLPRGQHDAAGADELHSVYVPHDHEAGREVDPCREGGRA